MTNSFGQKQIHDLFIYSFILNSLYRVMLQKTDLQTALLIYKTNYNIPINTIKIYA